MLYLTIIPGYIALGIIYAIIYLVFYSFNVDGEKKRIRTKYKGRVKMMLIIITLFNLALWPIPVILAFSKRS